MAKTAYTVAARLTLRGSIARGCADGATRSFAPPALKLE